MSRPTLLFAIAWLCVLASAGCVADKNMGKGRDQTVRDQMTSTERTARTGDLSAEESTQFFENHPNEIDVEERDGSILFASRQVGLEFRQSDAGFELARLYGIAEDQDLLAPPKDGEARNLFEITMALDPKYVGKDERGMTKTGGVMMVMDRMAKMGDAFVIGSQSGKDVSSRHEKGQKKSVLHLEWKGIDVREAKGVMDVDVTVTLRAGDPLSYWRIAIRNRSQKYGIERARVPILPLAPIGEAKKNVFIYPKWRGGYVEDPFNAPADLGESFLTRGAYYPYYVNMQFWALYNKETNKGIYVGTQDPTPSMMHIRVENTTREISWSVSHFPPNMTFGAEGFTLPYDCVAGPFRGDWYDACQIYRKWALKQSWCRKGPLSTREDIPKWYKEAPLFFKIQLADAFMGTNSVDKNLTIAADHFSECLKWAGVRLPVNFYTWEQYTPGLSAAYDTPFGTYRWPHKDKRWATHGHAAYDNNYPAIPALAKFSAECKRLRQEGGMVCPYVSLQMFNQGPTENAPYAAEGKQYMAREMYGSLLTYPGWGEWLPCVSTEWWQNRLIDVCVNLLERENVGGYYLDVMHGMAMVPCYWTPHGHSAGGGSSTTEGMHELARAIRDAVKARDPEVITTGEDSTENMIDVIDGVMLQRPLRPENKVPMFAAVYQDYIPRNGGTVRIRPGDSFFIECASLFVEGTQVGRIPLRPRPFSLSFQNPDHKEMIDCLGRVVGYYKQETAKKFLVYGQLMRPLAFGAPSPMPMLTHTSDAGSEGEFPALMSGVFRSDSGELGIFVVNAGTKDLDFQADLDLARYGMPADTVVDVDTFAPDGASRNVLTKAKGIVPLKGSLPGHHMTMFRLKPIARR